jgi:hypothetical protein
MGFNHNLTRIDTDHCPGKKNGKRHRLPDSSKIKISNSSSRRELRNFKQKIVRRRCSRIDWMAAKFGRLPAAVA